MLLGEQTKFHRQNRDSRVYRQRYFHSLDQRSRRKNHQPPLQRFITPCREQLKKTPEEHIADIKAEIALARENDMRVNIYLEDWSNGMIYSPEYVFALMDALPR